MSAAYRHRLADVRRAPKGAGRPEGLKTRTMKKHSVPIIVRACLAGIAGGFSAREVFDQVPEFRSIYKDANALGTALGHGVRGRGLGMYRDRDGDFFRCRENAALATGELDDAEFAALAHELGFPGPDDLAAAIDDLPPAPAN